MARSRLPATLLATGAACALAVAVPTAASAGSGAHTPTVRTLDSTLAAPFHVDATRGGVYVADGGLNQILRFRGGDRSTVATGPEGGDVSGVAVNRRGDLAYTTSTGGEEGITSSQLVITPRKGRTVTVDLLAFEREHNPDADVSYGIDNPTPCQEEAFAPLGGASSKGVVDSHAYSVAAYGNGWVVGDAGSNTLIKVSSKGRASTLALLPRQPTTITADAAAALGLPDCVVGAVYNFEPVPTGVEVYGRALVTSLLPGGPEDPSLGARGSVYTVNPHSGRSHRVAGGFLGATDVAVGPHGKLFVAELFAGRISVISHGTVRPYVELPGALSVDYANGTLFAGTGITGPGSLVAIR